MRDRLQRLLRSLRSSLRVKEIRRVDFILAIVVTLCAVVVYAFVETSGRNNAALRFLENIEARSLDARFNLRGERPHDQNIVIVGLDEKTLQRVGAFPIPRNAYARMVDQLAKDGAKLVAFDENFPVPEKNSAVEALKKLDTEVGGHASPQVTKQIRQLEATSDNDAILAESLKRAGNVVLGHLFLDPERARSVSAASAQAYLDTVAITSLQTSKAKGNFDITKAWNDNGGMVAQGVYANIPSLANAARSYGFFDEEPDPDGSYRRAILVVRYDQAFYPSLDIEAVRQAENIPDENVNLVIAENGVDRLDLSNLRIIPAHDGSALINYAGPYKTYTHYSMIDVINGDFAPGTFKNKIVVFGATAVAIGDIRNTPYLTTKDGTPADYMGVELHANTIDNLLHANERGRGFLRRGYREEGIDLFFILAFGLGLGYWFSHTKPLTATLSVIVGILLFGCIVYGAFAHYGMWLAFVIPSGTIVANYASITSFRMIFEEREKRRVKKMFGSYLSPGMIKLMEKDPDKYLRIGGESKNLTVMFSDIRSFTTISEGLTPNELVFLLNEYLGEMTDILFRRWGTLDKYIGDAIMAFWGFPYDQDDDAIRACACALDMRLRLQELNAKWAAEGRKQLSIGIGLNTGEVNVGNMGSTQRMALTVMGDNVNLASRLEGTTKAYHVQCIVSESTYLAAKEHYTFREIDQIKVKGKMLPVKIFELMDWAKNESLYTERIVRFSEALTAYRRQQFEEAIDLFAKLQDRFPEEHICETFVHRSHDYMQAPPAPDWDGVYEMKEK